jgi:hypothetical protein
MNLFPRCIVPLLAILAFPMVARGEPRKVSFRTLCFQPVNNLSSLTYLKGAEQVEVELPRMNLSKRYECVVERELVLGNIRTIDGKPEVEPLARAEFPAGDLQEAVLLFLPAPAGSKLPFHVTVFNFDRRSLAGGETLFVNLSDQEIAGLFGDRQLALSPGKVAKLEAIKKVDEQGRYYVNLRSKTDGQWRPLCKSWWRADPEARKLALIFREPDTRRLRVFSFPDRQEPKAEEGTTTEEPAGGVE